MQLSTFWHINKSFLGPLLEQLRCLVAAGESDQIRTVILDSA